MKWKMGKNYNYERMLVMKNLTKFVSSVLSIGVLATGGITAFAATDIEADTSTSSSNPTISQGAPDISSMKRSRGSFGEMEKREPTDEQKTEMAEHINERLAEQLKDGKITQEQYNQAITDVEEGERPNILREGRGGFGNMEKRELTDEQKTEMAEHINERLAEQLKDGKITQEQYDQAITDVEEGERPNILREGRGGFGNMKKSELANEQK